MRWHKFWVQESKYRHPPGFDIVTNIVFGIYKVSPILFIFSKCMLYADERRVYLADSDLSNLNKKLNGNL